MCQWCQVEGRVYRSFEDRERKALEEIRRIEEECQGRDPGVEECPDRIRCLWEKKLEFVVARFQKERLAVEMADPGACDPEEPVEGRRRSPLKPPAPSLSPHLLGSFERYIASMFDRLTRETGAAPPARRRKSRKLIPFGKSGESSH